MTKVIRFNTQACRRCGGTGRHSYNAMHGDVCYGCSGKGRVRTAAAKRAAAALGAWYDEHATVPVTDLQPFERVFLDYGGDRGWRTVREVSIEPGYSSSTNGGVKHEAHERVVITFEGRTHGYQFPVYTTKPVERLRRPLTESEREKRLEFAATLSGLTIEEKEEVPA